MSILEIEGLTVAVGAQEILHGIDLAVPERGIVAVLGANGVGKTTLMRTISGIYRPTAGRIRFLGDDIAHADAHEIVKRGLL